MTAPRLLPQATETAVIMAVPAVEPVVGRHRRTLDHSAAWGVPPHVTVLYPFLPPAQVTNRVLADLENCLTAVVSFACVFAEVRWFGDDVVWLSPEPAAPLRVLTDLVVRRFPGHPPYGGEHADPIPHLTVGSTGTPAARRQAADEVRRELPVRTLIDRVQLIAGTDAPGSWYTVAEFSLRTLVL